MLKSIFKIIFKTILPCAENIFITTVTIFVVGAVGFVVGVTAGRADSPLHSGAVLHQHVDFAPDIAKKLVLPLSPPTALVMKVIADDTHHRLFHEKD